MSAFPIHRLFSMQGPDVIHFGWGCLEQVGKLVQEYEAKRVFVVTDQGIREAGLLEGLLRILKDAGAEYEVFDSVEPEPSVETCDRAAEAARAGDFQLVIGLGGGSCMDVAKVTSVMAVHHRPTAEFLGMNRVPGRGLPKILCPTTAGTGSEVTHIAVLTHLADGGAKKVMYSRHLFANAAVVDPALTLHCPPRITAGSGIDALTHAIEGYVSILRNPISDMFSAAAIPMLAKHVRTATLKGAHNPEARYYMALGATLAGLSFMNSSVAAVHAVSNPLGVKYKLPHGMANAIVLPAVMEYNIPAEVTRYAQIARWLGVPDDPLADERELAYRGAQFVRQLCIDCGIEPRMSHYGVTRDDFDEFVDMVFKVQAHNLERNPRDINREQLRQIYEMAL